MQLFVESYVKKFVDGKYLDTYDIDVSDNGKASESNRKV